MMSDVNHPVILIIAIGIPIGAMLGFLAGFSGSVSDAGDRVCWHKQGGECVAWMDEQYYERDDILSRCGPKNENVSGRFCFVMNRSVQEVAVVGSYEHNEGNVSFTSLQYLLDDTNERGVYRTTGFMQTVKQYWSGFNVSREVAGVESTHNVSVRVE